MTDRGVFRAVVLFLGGTLVVTVVGIAVLAGLERGVPGILENIAVGCLTGLAGLLARGPSDEPQDVRITNRPGEAVPVDDAGHADALTVLAGIVVVALGVALGTLLLRLL